MGGAVLSWDHPAGQAHFYPSGWISSVYEQVLLLGRRPHRQKGGLGEWGRIMWNKEAPTELEEPCTSFLRPSSRRAHTYPSANMIFSSSTYVPAKFVISLVLQLDYKTLYIAHFHYLFSGWKTFKLSCFLDIVKRSAMNMTEPSICEVEYTDFGGYVKEWNNWVLW